MARRRLSDRQFGLAVAVVLLVVAGAGWVLLGRPSRWALTGAGVFGLAALVVPGLLLPLNRLWDRFALFLGKLVNFVLLAAFFYVLVLPLGFIIRLSGRDPMHRKPEPEADTYWTPVTRHTDDQTLRDMF